MVDYDHLRTVTGATKCVQRRCGGERVAARDFAALARIHVRFGGKLAAICLRITGSSESAEDALQEAYIKLWNRAGSYDRSISCPMVWRGTLADRLQCS